MWWTLPAPCRPRLGRRLVVDVEPAALLAARLPAVAGALELERLEQAGAGLGRGAVGARGVEALQRQLGRDLGMLGDQRRVGDLDDEQLVIEALGVGEAQALALARRLDAVRRPSRSAQKSSASAEATRQTIRCTIPAPARPRRRAGVLEEGQVGARIAALVGEEEVVDGRVVLVDGFLDQPQAQHAGVEVDVALGVLGDRGYVVNALQLHVLTYTIPPMSRGRRRTVKGARRARLGPRLPQRLRDLDRAPGAQHRRLGLDQRPLLQNSTIRAALGNYLVDQLYENVDVEKELEEILPGDTKELAGPAAGGLRQVAGDGAEKVLETSTAQRSGKTPTAPPTNSCSPCWKTRAKRSRPKKATSASTSAACSPTSPARSGSRQTLAEKLPPDAGKIEILRSDELKTAQNIAVAIKGLALVLSILTFLAFGLAIYLSRDGRWVTVLFSGIGLIAAGFAVIVARHIAGGIVVDQLVNDGKRQAGGGSGLVDRHLADDQHRDHRDRHRRPLRRRRLARLADAAPPARPAG